MKEKLLFLISVILLFSFAAVGQQNPKDTNKNTESKKDDTGLYNEKERQELEKSTKDLMKTARDLMMFTHKLSQAPFKELTKTKDVREEAEKYFQAWMNSDAAAILGYQPPFKVKENKETSKLLKEMFKEAPGLNPNKPTDGNLLDEIKSTLEYMNKDTVKYNSVEIGEIMETGILVGKDAPKERIFAVVKYKADVYIKGEKDIVNGNVIGYTDGKKWYFVDRPGLSEKILMRVGEDLLTEKP
jgi:hypothetical protein